MAADRSQHMPDATRIGTVTIHTTRVYPLDAASEDPHRTEVVVEPGDYALYKDGISIFWMLTGRINVGRMHRLGDGIFTMTPKDISEGPEVTFPSRVYGPAEFEEFRSTPLVTPGSPEHRITIDVQDTGVPGGGDPATGAPPNSGAGRPSRADAAHSNRERSAATPPATTPFDAPEAVVDPAYYERAPFDPPHGPTPDEVQP